MKILNIDYHIGKYTVEINNCIDYNIAGASSFYDIEYFELYCAFWGLFSNYSFCSQKETRKKILNILGLKLVNFKISDTKLLIDSIMEKIDLEQPVIINVPNSVLFYSIMYKNKEINYLNHSFIINGYDEEKKIFYIRENSINTEVLSLLTYSQPFSAYCITFEMIINIYIETERIINDKSEIDNFFEYLIRVESSSLDSIRKMLLDRVFGELSLKNDVLAKEIDMVLNENYFPKYFNTEQFRRTTIHSLKALFDQLIKNIGEPEVDSVVMHVNKFLILREKIVNVLSKNSIRNSNICVESFKKLQLNLLYQTNVVYNLLKTNTCYYDVNKLYKKVELNDAVVTCDSEMLFENKIFFSKNVISSIKVNENTNFWMSNRNNSIHWIQISLQKKILIYKIIVEHKLNLKYITKEYNIFYSNDGHKWLHLRKIKNNFEIKNIFNFFDPIEMQYLKIKIIKPNSGIDYSARISNIMLFTK